MGAFSLEEDASTRPPPSPLPRAVGRAVGAPAGLSSKASTGP